MITLGKGAKRPVKTNLMSRYACYLTIQNTNPRKEFVASGQTYFAVQNRKQELADQQRHRDRSAPSLAGRAQAA
jgi:DNA-damage-inducible protein D